MTEQTLNLARTALVLIDLQNSNVKRELAPYTAEQTVGNCVLLAQEMRSRGAEPWNARAGHAPARCRSAGRRWNCFG